MIHWETDYDTGDIKVWFHDRDPSAGDDPHRIVSSGTEWSVTGDQFSTPDAIGTAVRKQVVEDLADPTPFNDRQLQIIVEYMTDQVERFYDPPPSDDTTI